ncbi:RNA polymerase I-specific transcription initiation factor rrn3 [Dissostichus eleginoides]|uniref:RNA polymerase I-specific transcription initiation factor rrn3 n=1 Tax=Dissostichus eleginoides TaxID=100907 RepID=A0AAD9CC05_DISEL|nr:RNA polymerase I-specific transcription initiation factor rrn3 [Dissostichus eleginoides]
MSSLCTSCCLQFQQDNLTPEEAVQYIEACLIGLTELCLEPGEQQRKMLDDAMNGTYRGVELKNTTTDTLATDRKRITDMLAKHIESRLGDLLSTERIVQKFSALDHNVWPKLGNSDESKEACVLHGRAHIESLCHHYQSILVREGTTVTEV